MAILSLVQDNQSQLMLHSTERSRKAEFSIFDISGEGSGDPFDYGTNEWTEVEGVSTYEYDPEYNDSFWDAQQALLKECVTNSIELPEYAEIWQV